MEEMITEGSMVRLANGQGLKAEVETLMGPRVGVRLQHSSVSGMGMTTYKEVSLESVRPI